MKKIIYAFLLLFSFLTINSAYAVDSYTNPQDLGNGTGGVITNPDGSVTIPSSNSQSNQNGNAVSKEVSQVTEQGMNLLGKLIDEIQSNVEKNLKSSLQAYYQKITAPIIPVFAGFIIIWISFQAIKMMLGMAVEIQGVIATFVIMLLIWSIVFSWDAFYPYVAEVFLDDIPNLISEMTGTDANSTLKTFVKIVFDVISTSMASVDTGITNVVSGLFFVLMYLCLLFLAVILCGIFFLIWILCKMIIGVLITVAPIFIACALFPATRKYATNWLNAVLVPNVIVLLMVITCDLFLTGVINAYQDTVGESGGGSFIVAFVLQITLVIVIGMFLLIPKIAISLVGQGFEASSSGAQGIMNSGKVGLKKLFSK